jgi:hypothetical protein
LKFSCMDKVERSVIQPFGFKVIHLEYAVRWRPAFGSQSGSTESRCQRDILTNQVELDSNQFRELPPTGSH